MELDLTFGGLVLFGLLIGLQHAMEPDHVAAVASLASGHRSRRSILRHGIAWGFGHALMLGAIAGTAVVFGLALDGGIAAWLEFAVGIMLVGLGAHVLRRLVRERIHFHVHRHDDGTWHLHAHSHRDEPDIPHEESAHDHEHTAGIPWRALAVGLMHGIAGSAALVVLTVTATDNAVTGLLYVAAFGVGSVIGMAALSVVIAVPLGWTGRRLTRFNHALQGVIGAGTVALGGVIMYVTQIADWIG